MKKWLKARRARREEEQKRREEEQKRREERRRQNHPRTRIAKDRKFYQSPHRLRKMFVKDEEVTVKEPGRGYLSGGFFLFLGGLSGEYKEGSETKHVVTQVRFAWEIKDNTYIITTLPLEQIRIKVVDQIEVPTVSFFLSRYWEYMLIKEYESRWYSIEEFEERFGGYLENYHNPHPTFSKYLVYAIITVKNEDWPKNINLPVNRDFSS
jgi:hypothetical protein